MKQQLQSTTTHNHKTVKHIGCEYNSKKIYQKLMMLFTTKTEKLSVVTHILCSTLWPQKREPPNSWK